MFTDDHVANAKRLMVSYVEDGMDVDIAFALALWVVTDGVTFAEAKEFVSNLYKDP